MKIKTSELSGPGLDWAVAKCEGYEARNNCVVEFEAQGDIFEFVCFADDEDHAREQLQNSDSDARFLSLEWLDKCSYTTNWAHGGPIIERERIDVFSVRNGRGWCAQSDVRVFNGYGPTPLIAAMRCYVASKLGDDVEIPEELK